MKLPQMIRYVKCFNNNNDVNNNNNNNANNNNSNKAISFKAIENKLFKKYTEISKKG